MSEIFLKREVALTDAELGAASGGFIGETVSNKPPSEGQNGCTRSATTETTDKRGYCTAHEA